jgi:phosphatidylglycerophosphatase C
MKKLAIYDIDYTILNRDSLVLFFWYCLKRNPAKIIYLPLLAIMTPLFLMRIISMERFKGAWVLFVKNMTESQLDKLAKSFYLECIVPAIKDDVLQQIRNIRKKGYTIVLATASFEFYMKYLSEKIEADYLFGTLLVKKGKRVQAKIDGKNCKGKEKIKRITAVIPRDTIDTAKSVAFTDSRSDLPFLDLASKLYMVKKREWDFLDTITR